MISEIRSSPKVFERQYSSNLFFVQIITSKWFKTKLIKAKGIDYQQFHVKAACRNRKPAWHLLEQTGWNLGWASFLLPLFQFRFAHCCCIFRRKHFTSWDCWLATQKGLRLRSRFSDFRSFLRDDKENYRSLILYRQMLL